MILGLTAPPPTLTDVSVAFLSLEASVSLMVSLAPGSSSDLFISFLLTVISLLSFSLTLPFSTLNSILSVTVYPSGAILSSSLYLPSGSPEIITGDVPDTNDILFFSTVMSASDIISEKSGVVSIAVIVRCAPGTSAEPDTLCLLIVTVHRSGSSRSVIMTVPSAYSTTSPFSTVNVIDSAVRKPSGALSSVSVYVPSGIPSSTAGTVFDFHEILLPEIFISTFDFTFSKLLSSAIVSVSSAPGSSEPDTFCLLIVTFEGASSITTSFPDTSSPSLTSNSIVSSLTVYPSGAVISVRVYLPSGSIVSFAGVFASVTNEILSEPTYISFAPPPTFVSRRFAPGVFVASTSFISSVAPSSSSVPFMSFLLTNTSEYSSIIFTVFPVESFTNPSSTVNVTAPVTVYPSGATLSSSVYVPSGRPITVTGVFPDTHVIVLSFTVISASDVTLERSAFPSAVIFRWAPGTSAAPDTSCLLIVTFEGVSSITTSFPDTSSPSLTSNSIVSSLTVYPSGAVISVRVYLPSGSIVSFAGVFASVTNEILSEPTYISFAPPPTFVSRRFAPGVFVASTSFISSVAPSSSSVPFMSFLLTNTSEYSSIIFTVFPVESFTNPSSTVNVTAPVTVYPSGATLSSSVYVPSGRPITVTGVFPDTHVIVLSFTVISASDVTLERSAFPSAVIFRWAPGTSAAPDTLCLLITISDSFGVSASIIITLSDATDDTVSPFFTYVFPSLRINSIVSAFSKPSGALTSVSVYSPSGRPSITAGFVPEVHFTVFPLTVIDAPESSPCFTPEKLPVPL